MFAHNTHNKDWELIRSANEIENEVDLVDEQTQNIYNNYREYGSIEIEGGQTILGTISDEISEEIDETNFTSSTPITPMALSTILPNDDEIENEEIEENHDHQNQNENNLRQDQQQIIDHIINDKTQENENKVFFKSIDEIIDDLKDDKSTKNVSISSLSKPIKSKKKRRVFSYKSRRAKRFTNRRQARKTK